MPHVSVIIPNWNGAHLLPVCLDSIRQQTFRDYEIIIPENASTDGSIELIVEHYPEAKLIRFSENLGFSRAVNEGIRQSRGQFIALLNNDTELDPRYLAELVAVMADDPKIGICAPKMVYYDETSMINSAGHACGPDGIVVDIGRRQPDREWFNQPREVLGACAGAALYRRRMFEGIGLFDPDFFLSFEDADLNWRAQWAGWRARYVQTAIVKHREGASREIRSTRAMFLGLRNSIYVWTKDWPSSALVRQFPHIWNGWRQSAISLIRTGHGHLLLAVLFAALPCMPRMLARRRRIFGGRKVPVERFYQLLEMGARQISEASKG